MSDDGINHLKVKIQKTVHDLCEIDELFADAKIIMARLLKRLNET